uniref:Obscurin-like protein 1 n=1 Tax=Podarcis muralis TaxID=64176 RepID=A0A670JNG3_PODMU
MLGGRQAGPLTAPYEVPGLSCIPSVPTMDAFGGAPRFLTYPRTFTVPSGTNAVLKWQVAGEPRPSVAWEKDGSVLDLPSGRMLVEADGDAYSLLVYQAGPADSGRYVCKAKNSVGETYAAATLKVEAAELKPKGELDIQPPVFLNRPVSARVTRGEDVTFACRVSGELEWEKDGWKLSDIFESSHYKVGRETGDWHSLHIYNTRLPDAGVYVCRAQNSFGETMAAAVLLVDSVACVPHSDAFTPQNSHFKKQLEAQDEKWRWHHPGQKVSSESRQNGEVLPSPPTPKAFTVNEGKHAKFRCYVTGKPKPEIVWQKDGMVLSPGRRHLLYEDREGYFILKVLYCTARDCGLYVCTACNTAGQTLSAVSLHVKEPRLRFQAPLVDVEVLERQDAVLECQVPLETIPTAWYLEDKRLQPSPKYLMEEQGLLRRLTVRDARADDDGIYLCEMEGKGRSVGELSVQGLIVKRLPRKLDVMEGENAAFYVETREPVEAPSWGRNGQELVEAPHTLIRSFGKTHLLVLVHVTRHDAGVITFTAGESQTSAQLRVKCAKRIPPSAPVAARMCMSRNNAALLTWCPPPDVHRSPPSSYILERQAVGEAEWVPCLTTDVASMVEVPGDGVPQEADYRFRVCSANQYGCSGHVEFPGTVHLVPRARIQKGLQDVKVHAGEDATFSVQLSASQSGCWFFNGKRLEEEEGEEGQQYQITHSGLDHALRIKGVQLAANGSEVQFEANGVKECAALCVQAPQVHITPVPEARRHRTLTAGMPLLLECEVSIPDTPINWFKEGNPVALDDSRVGVQTEGRIHRLLISSVCSLDSGTYTCDAGDDAISFTVTVDDPPVRILHSSAEETHAYRISERVVLACQLSRPDAPVRWYKDGEEVEESERLLLESEGSHRRLVIASAQIHDTGEFVCDAGGDSAFFNITITEPPVHVVCSNAEEDHTYQILECVTLSCELSRPDAPVLWYKDGEEVEESEGLRLESEGSHHRLVIASACVQDTGEFVCDAGTDRMESTVKVAAPPVHIVNKNDAHVPLEVQEGENMTLVARLSQEKASVRWLKNMRPLYPGPRLVVSSEGAVRSLTIRQTEPGDSGTYTCDTGDDEVHFTTYVQEAPVLFVPKPEHPEKVLVLEGGSAVLSAIVSKEPAMVRWEGPRGALVAGDQCQLRREGRVHSLLLSNVGKADAGEYICHSHHDQLRFELSVKELPVKFVRGLSDVLALQGETVLFWCELCKTKGDVLWLKDGQELEANEHQEIRAEGRERSLTLRHVGPEDAGEYSCESKDDRTLAILTVQIPRSVEIISELHNLTVLEGDDATFKAVVSPDDVALKWQHHGQDIVPSERFATTRVGLCHTLTIQQCRLSDTGIVTVHAEGLVSSARLSVQEAQVIFVQTLRDLMAEEGQDVCLEVELSLESAEVQWMKQGILLQQNTKYSMEACGSQRTLTIHNIELADRGTYRCESLHDRTQARLSVEPRRVTVRKPLLDVETFEKETVTFELELSHANVAGVWTRDGIRVKPGSTCRVSATGFVHSLTLLGLTLDDSGTVAFTADTVRSSARLTVQEPPVTMLRFPQDMGIPETGSATFECELSRPLAEVKWYKVRVLSLALPPPLTLLDLPGAPKSSGFPSKERGLWQGEPVLLRCPLPHLPTVPLANPRAAPNPLLSGILLLAALLSP